MSQLQSNTCEYIEAALTSGFKCIAGVDEVGRGPLAGPVVAAACILPEGFSHPDLKDSKKLSPAKRKGIVQLLKMTPGFFYGIGVIESDEIDKINILQASLKAMVLAVRELTLLPDYLLIDGNRTPLIDIASEAIIKGDSKCPSISAASNIAKVYRDDLMDDYHKKWPQYGFDSHRGYPTKAHLNALTLHGPLAVHRHSFGPIKKFVEGI
ncbi:MAG: ribonuclease HII [Simkaniaceae bacterium]|nr:ribonuclease HII [Simkaniaceae bacterium]